MKNSASLLTMLCVVVLQSQIKAEVIYDSLWIHDEFAMDAGVGNGIGGKTPFPQLGTIDSQIAEDFVLENPTTLTRAVIDIMSHGGTVPAEGIWIQIYEDIEGVPSEDVAFEQVAARDTYTAEEIESPLEFRAWRVDIDLADMGFELEAGTWWVNFQPLDVDTHGDWFWFIASISVEKIGHPSHVRDGWLAHGNEYRGLWNSTVWKMHNFRGNAVLSWRLEGTGASFCRYRLKKNTKSKGGCDSCPSKDDLISSGDECEKKRDCPKRIKGSIACPDGGPGLCKKIKGKRDRCGA